MQSKWFSHEEADRKCWTKVDDWISPWKASFQSNGRLTRKCWCEGCSILWSSSPQKWSFTAHTRGNDITIRIRDPWTPCRFHFSTYISAEIDKMVTSYLAVNECLQLMALELENWRYLFEITRWWCIIYSEKRLRNILQLSDWKGTLLFLVQANSNSEKSNPNSTVPPFP